MSRTQSPATQLRHLKTRYNALKGYHERVADELKQRRQWGQMMSNLCYNLSQNDAYDPQHRQSMKDCREGWDSIKKVSL